MDEQTSPPPDKSDKAGAAADKWWAALNERAEELRAQGLSRSVAMNTAEVESRIAQWPPTWGNDLCALIYGDFDPPPHELHYPSLGITIEPEKLTNTIIRSALCVLKARVKVREKTLPEVLDATARLNTFLGVWTAIDWGNRGLGWWCHLTHGTMAGVGGSIEKEGVQRALEGVDALRPDVRRKVLAALYWMREPMQMMMEKFRSDTLRVYAGYWNALECLVEATCLVVPQSKMTKQQKLDGIAQFIADRGGKPGVAALGECYRSFVDPGFVAKASHALRVCRPERADGYIVECFRVKPDQERLYAIRNAINHGDIDFDSLQELARVDDKCHRLKLIVMGMLGRFLRFSYPVDPGPR
jgi:hypothetical protein